MFQQQEFYEHQFMFMNVDFSWCRRLPGRWRVMKPDRYRAQAPYGTSEREQHRGNQMRLR